MSLLFSLFEQLKGFKPFDFHHQIQFLLLLLPLLLQTLVFFQLLVSNSDYFAVQHHLIHLLYVFFILIQQMLSLVQYRLFLFCILNFLLSHRKFSQSCCIHLNHSLLSQLRGFLLLRLLLSYDLSLLFYLVFGFDNSCILHSLKIIV